MRSRHTPTARRAITAAITIRDVAPAVPPVLGRPSVTVDGSTRPASRLPPTYQHHQHQQKPTRDLSAA